MNAATIARGTRAARPACAVLATLYAALCNSSATPVSTDAASAAIPAVIGPFNATFLAGGIGIARDVPRDSPLLSAGSAWSVVAWIRPAAGQTGISAVAALGDTDSGECICMVLDAGRPGLHLPGGELVRAESPIPVEAWTSIAASDDGATVRLYIDGRAVAQGAHGRHSLSAHFALAPNPPSSARGFEFRHFGGSVAAFRWAAASMPADEAADFARARPNFEIIDFIRVGVGWPVQEKAWIGMQAPQDAWTLPVARSAPPSPVAATPSPRIALRPTEPGHWIIGAWRLAVAADVKSGGAELSRPRFDDAAWYPATVPGTVLSTLIDRGVYADPDFGLNNLSIPESLSRQDYWYRTSFVRPRGFMGRRLVLTFKGINYAAEIYLNGARVGAIKGAFLRGSFDVTKRLAADGSNVLAVRISPPPHPGIPSEESIAFGPGENGGSMALDGPTFLATEGWDWIPAMRDRDAGIWQDVELTATGAVSIGDAAVVSHLPLPRTDSARIEIHVPLDNPGPTVRAVRLEAQFDGISLAKNLRLDPGRSEVRLDAREFPQLRIRKPRLWWPNGYGAAVLHDMTLRLRIAGRVRDSKHIRFGIRELSYELSLFDKSGRLRRVEIDPAAAEGVALVDSRHEAIKRVVNGWAQSLTAAGENSPAVHDIPTESLSPNLVLRVNGTPIAARGGSWGMDDSRKRISRARLEPYFRLHREAHLNTIRNWLGQNTEDVFYDLADEYGLLILNDFWESTQDFQLEAQDPALFLENARDVIARYRNHPSIAVWFGRNEGVPQPILNEGLAELVRSLDGTRLYMGSSNRVNLQDSGPYSYRPPEGYFTDLGQGFAVEIGTPSLSTLESLRASIPAADRWPLSDTIAYHDWHFGGNGDVHSFMAALSAQFGDPTGLEDFERKSQLMNYADYRAIFEGFFAHLWTRNSGRILWMTHPAWPSNHWQIYSSDYDTQAAYYGVKKACEPVHVQMNLPDHSLAVVNTTRDPMTGMSVSSRVLSLDGRIIAERKEAADAPANEITTLAPLVLGPTLQTEGVVLVALRLEDANGAAVSENVYWQSRDDASSRRLASMPLQPVRLTAAARFDAGESVVDAILTDTGSAPAIGVKLTLLDAFGERILPAFYDDNYLSLLPGETRRVAIRFPPGRAAGALIGVRGMNIAQATVAVEPPAEETRP